MIGGMDNDNGTIKDYWILDVNEKSWTKVSHRQYTILPLLYNDSYKLVHVTVHIFRSIINHIHLLLIYYNMLLPLLLS